MATIVEVVSDHVVQQLSGEEYLTNMELVIEHAANAGRPIGALPWGRHIAPRPRYTEPYRG